MYYVIFLYPFRVAPSDMTEDDLIIPAHSKINNQIVHCTLDELTTGTDDGDRINTHGIQRNVHKSCIAMCEHYDGSTKLESRVAVARPNIVKTFYKNETKVSFKNYSTRLKKLFDMLCQYVQLKINKEEVDILINQIHRNNVHLVSSIQICISRFSNNFL